MGFPLIDLELFRRGVTALEAMASSLNLILGEIQEINKRTVDREHREAEEHQRSVAARKTKAEEVLHSYRKGKNG